VQRASATEIRVTVEELAGRWPYRHELDGSVFEPDYECPSGASVLGWLEFEPSMPFPRNGGVCCPPQR
jgi:hypothetical protein